MYSHDRNIDFAVDSLISDCSLKATKLHEHNSYSSTNQCSHRKDYLLKENVKKRVRALRERIKSREIHSPENMAQAGFSYVGTDNSVRCNACQLKISEWTNEMIPLLVHYQRNPNCPFIQSQIAKPFPILDDQERNPKRLKAEISSDHFTYSNRMIEVKPLKEARIRTFSHWSRLTKPSSDELIFAGFFACNVGDRVICLYCNLICQQWTPDIDDPIEVHRTLSPNCPYVLSMLMIAHPFSTVVLTDPLTTNDNEQLNPLSNIGEIRSRVITSDSLYRSIYNEEMKRQETFAIWSTESSPSVESLVKSGFFYRGVKDTVTCFACGGSLKNLRQTHDPIIEHVRWFPNCIHARKISGEETYRQVQEVTRLRLVRMRINQSDVTRENTNMTTANHGQLQINDSTHLSRLIAARLDLQKAQNLLNQNYSLSIIKRCFEDQLTIKKDDFYSDTDLYIACVILKKQIDHINGRKENIVIPSIQMKLVREREQAGLLPTTVHRENNETTTHSTPAVPEISQNNSNKSTINQETPKISDTENKIALPISNPCVACRKNEKNLACIPCGHFVTCLSCHSTLRTCPICRVSIEAFVRIYV